MSRGACDAESSIEWTDNELLMTEVLWMRKKMTDIEWAPEKMNKNADWLLAKVMKTKMLLKDGFAKWTKTRLLSARE